MSNFLKLASGVDVGPLALELFQAPHLWDQQATRRLYPGTPHAAMRDIWVRFRPVEELRTLADFKTEFRNAYWPAWYQLPSLRPLVRRLKHAVDATELGSILITRLPPGAQIEPHSDAGSWAPEFYNTKVHVQIAGTCVSTCDGDAVRMVPGDVWTFDNLKTHAVHNDGPVDRIVLIVSMRTEP